ncbi:thermonuclease family protein [Mycolicibacterium mageritense]|uniref:thermonuclease family protein n=1 Tax=Mycolicibacterium mageritense TaxID=53462 RepID=UPI003F6827F3
MSWACTAPGGGPPSAVNRTLGYLVLPDGRDFSVEAARAGMAQSVTYGRRPAQKFADIEAAQADAQAAHRGLWGPPCWGAVDSVPE